MEHHMLAILLAVVIDFMIGDPPTWPHPVRWIGSGIGYLEKRLNQGKHRKAKGFFMVLLIISITFLTTLMLVSVFYQLHPVLGIVAEGLIIASAIAQKGLKDAALAIYHPLRKGNMKQAREKLSYIVGRDTEHLDEKEIVRGTVETVAENTSDGVTAPLFWALIGGAPLAMVYRAINTCDSMVGYKNEKYREFGWASARLDDLANWIPSRLTACLIVIGNKPEVMNWKKAWKLFFRDARNHPSPNSGWLEAAVAAILGVQLGGINYYQGQISERAKIGEPVVPLNKEHIVKTNNILFRTTLLFLLVLMMGGWLYELAAAWFESAIHI